MEPIVIERQLACLVHNASVNQEQNLMSACLVWSEEKPLDVRIIFPGLAPDIRDVEWTVGVSFLQEALEQGQAGHPNVSPCLAEASGEDFILTLRGFSDSGQIVVSHITFDTEQVLLFVCQIRREVGLLDYAPEIERLIASLPSE